MTIGREAVNTHPASGGGRFLHGRDEGRPSRFHATDSCGCLGGPPSAVRGALL